jgi:uncharacterized caspase-like protein
VKWVRLALAALLVAPLPVLALNPGVQSAPSPVEAGHLRSIEKQFARNGLSEARVGIDDLGRIVLQGNYKHRKEVELAFSLAQTVVGVKWVSPVVPENIRVKEWEQALSKLFPSTDSQPPASGPEPGPPGRLGQTYAIVIGVGQFREKVTPLRYAAKDARDFYTYLTHNKGANFKKENVILLTDAAATRANIAQALERVRAQAQTEDLVLLYFSSHGTPPNIYGSVHVVTYDSVVKPRHAIWDSSVTDEMLRDFIQGVRAKRLIVIMDTCYSNGAYNQVEGFLPTGGKSLGGEDEAYGVSKSMAKRLLGAKDLVLVDEFSRSTGRKQQGWGRVLLSASGPEERSWESETLKNSFFTHYFLDGLKNYGDVKQAFEYARPRVTKGVMEEKQQPQHPQAAADNPNWAIGLTQ